ncbi:MAG: gliding motility-associated C-terminal domain-containing protein [Chitinophagales bacterium]
MGVNLYHRSTTDFAKILLVFLLLSCTGILFAQNISTDCAGTSGALGICSNETLNLNSNGPGRDDFASPNNSSGCIDEEHQSAWLFIQIDSGSTLGFIIDPIGSDDYDFAVYGPDRECGNLGSPIRCSWALGSGNTGMNGNSNDNSEGVNGNGFVRWLNVNPGETYYILIDNYSSSNQGFSLTWNGNASLNCDVTLPCPVVDLGEDTVICGNTSIEIGINTGANETYLWNTGATTSKIMVSDSGWYWLEVDKNGCKETDSIYVSKGVTPVIDLGNDTTLCEGESLLLDANVPEALNYLWSDGSTLPILLVKVEGNYSVRASNEFCSSYDEINVSYDQIPVIDLGLDTTLCNDGGLVLDASSNAANSYVWQDGSSGSAYTVTTSGSYTVTVKNTACSFIDSIHVQFKESPIFDLGADDSFCDGETVNLDASASNGTAYLWQDGSAEDAYQVTESGTYWVTVSIDECSTTDSIDLTFLAYPQINLPNDTAICEGEVLDLNAYSSVATDYLWQDGSMADSYLVTEAGDFTVQVSNEFCNTSDSITVTYNAAPKIDLGLDTILCKGNQFTLSIGEQPEGTEYVWQDNSTEAEYVVSEQGEYHVTVQNQCGTAYDTIFIEFGSCDCNFFVPTGFTPNNDGVNDAFYPIVDCDSITSYGLKIFNRWGETVYETNNPQQEWLGPNESNELPMDVYVWAIEYRWTWRGEEMAHRESGYISLLR